MRELLAFAERPDFQPLVERITQYSVVQGITIDVDPVWLHLAKIRQRLPGDVFENFVESDFYRFLGLPYGPGYLEPFRPDRGIGEEDLLDKPLDYKWLPKWWPEYCSMLHRPRFPSPIIVKITLLPWREGESLPEVRAEFPVVFERRAQARFCGIYRKQRPVLGGLSVGVGSTGSGTLGGIVEDQNGVRYAMTCAHVTPAQSVVDQPAQADNTSAMSIGLSQFSSALIPSSKDDPCNAENSLSRMNLVDAALISIDAKVGSDLSISGIGPLTGISPKANVQPGGFVYYVGKESGPAIRRLVTGGLNVTYRFKDSQGAYYCFQNTFQIRLPRQDRVAGAIPVEPGDSGAWLCRNGVEGYLWAGVVIGCDDDIGYAIFSEAVTDWANDPPRSLALRVM